MIIIRKQASNKKRRQTSTANKKFASSTEFSVQYGKTHPFSNKKSNLDQLSRFLLLYVGVLYLKLESDIQYRTPIL